jgi:hypothetical protein
LGGETTTEPTVAEDAVPAEVTLAFDITPDDATIHRGDDELKLDDGELTLPKGEEAITLRVSKAGFLDETVEVTPDADRDVKVTLEPVPRATGPLPQPAAPPSPKPSSVDDLLGERD